MEKLGWTFFFSGCSREPTASRPPSLPLPQSRPLPLSPSLSKLISAVLLVGVAIWPLLATFERHLKPGDEIWRNPLKDAARVPLGGK